MLKKENMRKTDIKICQKCLGIINNDLIVS